MRDRFRHTWDWNPVLPSLTLGLCTSSFTPFSLSAVCKMGRLPIPCLLLGAVWGSEETKHYSAWPAGGASALTQFRGEKSWDGEREVTWHTRLISGKILRNQVCLAPKFMAFFPHQPEISVTRLSLHLFYHFQAPPVLLFTQGFCLNLFFNPNLFLKETLYY